jgi:iron complex outermembrane receptor protein
MKALSAALVQALSAGAVVSVAATVANAQTAPAAPQKIEKIEVTGSNIKRVDTEGSSPVTIISREAIERSGATNAMEILSLVSSNQSAGNVSLANTIGATTLSANTASLRGLGGGRTLVLLNGKRLNTFSGEVQGVQGVNLTTIPFNAIERVEVLLDGASAIYGSDAIAGVINFILRKDYQGAEVTAYYGAPTRSGGGEQATFKGTAGIGDLAKDKYNAFIAVMYDEQKPLDQKDRNFSNTSVRPDLGLIGFSGSPFPGFVSTSGPGGRIGSVGFPNCPAPYAGFFPDVDPSRCYFDPSGTPGVNMIPSVKTLNVFGQGTFVINADWQAYVTANYSKQENNFVIQPVPIADVFGVPITLQPTSPFYPTAQAAAHGVTGPINVRWRAVENGLRDTTDTNEQWQFIAGIKGSKWNWDWDAWFNFNQGKTNETLNGGFPLNSRIQALLNSGRVNMFGPNTPAISQEVLATNYNGTTFDGKAEAYAFEVKGSSEIYQLPAGPLGLALGLQAGKESLSQTPSVALQTGDISGYGGNFLPIDKDRKAWAMYGELNIPIIKNLELSAAVRYDDYSDFGNTTNPKVGIRWVPTKEILVRASWGTGFLAPSLYQLWNPNVSGVSAPGLSDPLRCPTTNDTIDCFTQFGVTFGGNPNLKAERSEQTTVGFVFEPTRGLSFSADWFQLTLKDTVSNGPGAATILGSLDQFGNLVTRGPVQPQFPTLPGPITTIDQRYINLGETQIEGVDVSMQYAFPETKAGRFRFSLAGTYLTKYDSQQIDGSFAGFVSNAFGAVATGISPRWKSYIALSWDNGPWSATLGNTYQSSYVDYQTDGNGDLRTVSSMSLWDLYGSYKGIKNLTLSLGVKNLMDTNPPQSNQQNSFQVGFDPSYYDARARFVYGSVTYAFK